MTGKKHDDGKPQFSLIPPGPLLQVARVFTFGATKYNEDPDRPNYLDVEDGERRYIDAALRHINAHQLGDTEDDETGLAHLAHATSCLLMAMGWTAQENRNEAFRDKFGV